MDDNIDPELLFRLVQQEYTEQINQFDVEAGLARLHAWMRANGYINEEADEGK